MTTDLIVRDDAPDDAKPSITLRCATCSAELVMVNPPPGALRPEVEPCGWCGRSLGWFHLGFDGGFLRLTFWRRTGRVRVVLIPIASAMPVLAPAMDRALDERGEAN